MSMVSDISIDGTKCVLCRSETDERLTNLTDRGLQSLLDSSEKRNDTVLMQYIQSSPEFILVHNSCRKRYTDVRKFDRQSVGSDEVQPMKRLRSCTVAFNWKEMCFLCSGEIAINAKHPESECRCACTLEVRETVLKHYADRLEISSDDKWAFEVQGRMRSCCDLVAEEAVYHVNCYKKFCCYRSMQSDNATPGRRENIDMVNSFNKLCDLLECCPEELYTVSELHAKMKTIASDDDSTVLPDELVYSPKHFKRKLIDRYGDHIYFAEICGRKNVVCFRNMCSFIVNDKWYADKSATVEDKSARVIRTAAKLIAAQIREVEANTDSYPTATDMVDDNTDVIPPLLRTFLSMLMSSQLKQTSIGQCVVQAARPRSVIAPLLLGLALDLDLQHGSESLITKLARFGFSVSYDETIRYKQSVVLSKNVGTAPSDQFPMAFTHWVGDNVDHNIRTLDGSGTFHGMGIISARTFLNDNVPPAEQCIPRIKRRLTSAELCSSHDIPIIPCSDKVRLGLADISLKPVCHLIQPTVLPEVVNLDLVWHVSLLNSEPSNVRPNWLGYMQTVCVGAHCMPAAVDFMPLIDMNPSDETCIYSTIAFVVDQAKKLNVVPSITFDQPLWLKAYAISRSMHCDIVCRLGGFHLLMSFLGSIGKMMAGSGIEEVLAQIYGRDTVVHVMTGKAYARAIRGHFLIESAVVSKLLRFILPVDNSQYLDNVEAIDDFELAEAKSVAATIWSEKFPVDDSVFSGCATLVKVEQLMQLLKYNLSAQSRTAKLWINYVHYISVVKQFLVAERTGNWSLHLKCVGDMMNLFAATGHNNYAKSSRLYLQAMIDLPNTHPSLYAMYVQHGLHSTRRSDRYWAGVSTDLLIEQTMMRAIKGRGGLTRGRGFTEHVRTMWVKTAHHLGHIHLAISNMTGVTVDNADHTETAQSRSARDKADLDKVMAWFELHDPFSVGDGQLRSLSTGVTAGDNDMVTCDTADDVGASINQHMDNKLFLDVTLKRSEQIRTLHDLEKGSGKDSCRQSVIADTYTLFQRLIVLIERSVDVKSYFTYELTPSPAALFKNSLMRKADKPALARRMISDLESNTVLQGSHFVLDGGALLHRVRWTKKATFDDIAKQYIMHLQRCYGTNVRVVFDGYDAVPSTKDHEHKRRLCKAKSVCPDVAVHNTQLVIFDQEEFLANSRNKDRFIKLLIHEFQALGITAVQACGDADVHIVSAALELASTLDNIVSVVADDTDILMLLVHHYRNNMQDIYFVPRLKKLQCGQVSIRAVCTKLGVEVCKQLPLIHAIGGCDTTSALYGIGKAKVFNRVTARHDNRSSVAVMQNEHSTGAAVISAGLQLMVAVYGGNKGDNLGNMRHTFFSKLAATSKNRLLPEKLPPTECAAVCHVFRCHLQAVIWTILKNDVLDPLQWGWELVDSHLEPMTTDQPPAPDDLLNVIRCKCKTNCKSSLCSCRRNGLTCVTACASCRGDLCSNVNVNPNVKAQEDSYESVTSYTGDVWSDGEVDWIFEEVVDDCDVIVTEQVYTTMLFRVPLVKEE